MSVGTVASAALVKALVKPAQDIYDLGKDRLRTQLSFLRNETSLKNMAKSLRKIDKVKTFWTGDKETSLYSFYYPSRLILEGSRPTTVHSLADLPASQCYVVEGTVGQGKSIFLRFLASSELKRGGDLRIPIFAELRFLLAEEEFDSFLFSAFEAAGLRITPELFVVYAKSGRIVLFLDAFDELDPALVKKTIRNLDRLVGLYPNLQIIVSARPDSDIQLASSFRVVKLAPLARADHKPFLEKLTNNHDQAGTILKAINGSASSIDGLLTTPLLLTLLVMLYAAHQHIPDTVSEFYAELFDVLFYKHDRTKSGFRRKRHVEISDSKIKKLFEGVCFFSVLKGFRSFKDKQFVECLEQAGKSTLVDVDLQGLKNEFVKTACLLKEEGPELSFIHKSVQEFYSASFVARSSDEFARNFYGTLVARGTFRGWHQQLTFLAEIDEWRYSKFYWLPIVEKMASVLVLSPEELYSSRFRLSADHAIALMGNIEVSFYAGSVDSDGVPISGGNIAEMDPDDIHLDDLDWSSAGGWSTGPLFSNGGPLQSFFYALARPLRAGWSANPDKMRKLAEVIRRKAEFRKLSLNTTSETIDGIFVEITTFDDGSYSADFDLRALIEYAGDLNRIVADLNKELSALKRERRHRKAVVEAEEQKSSFLSSMTKFST